MAMNNFDRRAIASQQVQVQKVEGLKFWVGCLFGLDDSASAKGCAAVRRLRAQLAIGMEESRIQ